MFGKWKAWTSFRFMKMADLEQNSHAIHNLHQQFLPSHRPSSGAYLLHSILHTAMVTHAHHKNVIIQASMDSVKADHSSTAVQATHHPQATHHHPAVEAVPKHPAAQAIVARQHPVVQSAPRQPRKKLVDKISSFGGHTGKKVSVSESSTQKEQDRLAIHNLKLQ